MRASCSSRRRAVGAAVVAVLLLGGCAAAPDDPRAEPSARSTVTDGATAAGGASAPVRPGVEQRARALVAAMSPSERAGAVLMTAGTVEALPGLAGLVRQHRVAGVMVRGRTTAGVARVRAALAPARAAAPRSLPLLTATDQEGGAVQVLAGPGFDRIPSARRQAHRSPAALRAAAERWGRAMAAAGIRLDLAPVADVPCAAAARDNPPIADLHRDYGTDPVAAGAHVAAVVRGLRAGGVQSTAKHFPGLGCVHGNTDTEARVVDRDTTAASARLRPFRDAVGAGAGFVMMSSASYARIDAGVPALFSRRIVHGLLRDRWGFDGVVMSDDMGGAAALRAWSPGERAVRFVAAGGDLVLDVVPAHVPAMHRALVRRAAADRAFDARLRDAAAHVVAARLRLSS